MKSLNGVGLLLIILVILIAVLVCFHGSSLQAPTEQWITGVLAGILALTVPNRHPENQSKSL